MPTWVQNLSRYGNGLAALLLGLASWGVLAKGQVGSAFVLAAMVALAAFNVHVAAKAARLLSEEEWLAAEIRKAELRNKLAALQPGAAESAPPPRKLTLEAQPD